MNSTVTPKARSPRGASPEEVGTPRLRTPTHRVERRAVAWWTLRALAPVAALVAAGVGVQLWWESAWPWAAPLLTIALVASLLHMAVMPLWRYRVHRWEVTEHAVYARTGWWVREWRAAPISRIQTVDTVRGPAAQLLGLATLAVTTASAHGAIYIGGLDKTVAAWVAERLTEITQNTPGDQT